ncbi:MAG: hypothetical protein ACRC1T_01445 [Clostridium chrysemydis]|uniref:hypothetical protein n=1 Tax=Clostridium chrysemydis TaxID=2665504 RepID=UPI003F2D022E
MKKISTIITNKEKYDSYCDVRLKSEISHTLKSIILGVITLGIAYPWILCNKQKFKCEHTVICGKRLKFIGDPKELIGHWILWWFLIIITLGIYGLVVKIRFSQWITANTIFDDTEIK